jgi:hypothetical protein
VLLVPVSVVVVVGVVVVLVVVEARAIENGSEEWVSPLF